MHYHKHIIQLMEINEVFLLLFLFQVIMIPNFNLNEKLVIILFIQFLFFILDFFNIFFLSPILLLY